MEKTSFQRMIQCPKCDEVNSYLIEEDKSDHISCLQCYFPITIQSTSELSLEVEPILKVPLQGSFRSCPKCSYDLNIEAKECPSCKINLLSYKSKLKRKNIFSNFGFVAYEPVDKTLINYWSDLETHWDNEDEHFNFLSQCQTSGELAYAMYKYNLVYIQKNQKMNLAKLMRDRAELIFQTELDFASSSSHSTIKKRSASQKYFYFFAFCVFCLLCLILLLGPFYLMKN